MRVRATTVVDAVDLRTLRVVGAGVIRRLQTLRFDPDGVVHLADGRREGLRLLAGSHPRPGARYRVVLDGAEEPRPGTATPHPGGAELPAAEVELTHNDAHRLTLRVRPQELGTSVDVEVHDPPRPTAIALGAAWPLTGIPLVGGEVDGRAEATFGAVPAPGAPVPLVQAAATHRFGRGGLTVVAEDAGEGRWRITVAVEARGAGIARPLAAVAGIAARRAVRRGLVEVLAEVRTVVDGVAADLHRRRRDPDAAADEVVDGFYEAIAVKDHR